MFEEDHDFRLDDDLIDNNEGLIILYGNTEIMREKSLYNYKAIAQNAGKNLATVIRIILKVGDGLFLELTDNSQEANTIHASYYSMDALGREDSNRIRDTE